MDETGRFSGDTGKRKAEIADKTNIFMELSNDIERSSLWGWFSVMRPLNMLLTFGSVLLGGYLASEYIGWQWIPILKAAASASLILAAGNAFNDIFDLPSDQLDHPDRPLVTGRLSRKSAWFVTVICVVVGLWLAVWVSWVAFAVAVFVSVLLVVYSLVLKSIPLLGNLTVSIMAALTFPFGGIALGTLRGTEYPAVFALLFHLGHRYKD